MAQIAGMQPSDVRYTLNPQLTAAEFAAILIDSGMGASRPVDDPARLAAMIAGANVIFTARAGIQLLGVARAMSDGSWNCYLSELAVARSAQGLGVGRGLVDAVRRHIGSEVSLILASVPESVGFYESIGMPRMPDAFWFKRTR